MQTENLFESLSDLALDLRWAWNHAADDLWGQIDPELWELTHNAWLVLQTVSRRRLDTVIADEHFRQKLDAALEHRREREDRPSWFQTAHPKSNLTTVACFSMEFMLSDALPIFSGGLGNVAGDHLKAADDLGVPVIGIGLLYQQGYFRQHIDAEGNQIALRPFNEPGQLPVQPLRDANGEWLRISLPVPGYPLILRGLGATGRANSPVSAGFERPREPAGIPRHHG